MGGWRPTIILSAELRMVDAGQGGAARQPAASSQLSFMRSASCCLHDYGASGSNRLTAAGQVLRANDSRRRNLPFVALRGDRPLHLQQRPLSSDGQDEGPNDSPRQDDRLFATLLRHPRRETRRPEPVAQRSNQADHDDRATSPGLVACRWRSA